MLIMTMIDEGQPVLCRDENPESQWTGGQPETTEKSNPDPMIVATQDQNPPAGSQAR